MPCNASLAVHQLAGAGAVPARSLADYLAGWLTGWLTALSCLRRVSAGNVTASLSVCLDAIGWKGGAAPKVRDVWQKKDLGAISGGKYTATVKAHDTLLLKISS
jgi:hypothetical protein